MRRAMRSSKVVRASPSGARRTSGASSRTAASLASTGASAAPPGAVPLHRPEDQEVGERDGRRDQGVHPLLAVGPGEVVGVDLAPFGREHGDLARDAGGQEHLRRLGGRRQACHIAVEEDHDLAAIAALEQLQVLRRERRPADGDGVLHAGLVEADDVEVPLDQHGGAGLPDRLPGQVQAVEHPALLVEHGLGRVDVLGPLLVSHGAGAEADDGPVDGDDGEHEPAPEAVVAAPVALHAQAGTLDGGQRDLLRRQARRQVVPLRGGDAQPEAARLLLGDAARREVRPSGLAVRAPQASLPVAGGRVARREGLGALLALPAGLDGVLDGLLRDLDADLGGQGPHHLRELLSLELLQELEHVAVLAAAVALEVLVLRVHVEARRPLPVERAASLPRPTRLLEVDVATDHRHHVRPVPDLLDDGIRDHPRRSGSDGGVSAPPGVASRARSPPCRRRAPGLPAGAPS